MAGGVDDSTLADRARQLARTHLEQGFAKVEFDESILDYAELSRADDWSLRSALMRLAQPQPVLVRIVLEHVRRLDAAIVPLAKIALRYGVGGDARIVGVAGLARTASAHSAGDHTAPGRGIDEAVRAYAEVVELDPAELDLGPLLEVVFALDELADVVTGWAAAWTPHPPVDDIAGRAEAIGHRLDALAVPVESWDGPRGPRGRRT